MREEIERELRFRKRVREEFDRLVLKSESTITERALRSHPGACVSDTGCNSIADQDADAVISGASLRI